MGDKIEVRDLRGDILLPVQLKHILKRIKTARQELTEARLLLCSTLHHEKSACDEKSIHDIVSVLYWEHQDIPTTTISILTDGNARLVCTEAGPISVTFECLFCGKRCVADVASRSAFQTLDKNYRVARAADTGHYLVKDFLCEKCLAWYLDFNEKQRKEKELRQAAREAKRKKRLKELRTMPYTEYLKTPEWQETRKKALRRARFRCELCNAKDLRLDVHHKTYDNLGDESYKDLIVLCSQCHSKFHDKLEANVQ